MLYQHVKPISGGSFFSRKSNVERLRLVDSLPPSIHIGRRQPYNKSATRNMTCQGSGGVDREKIAWDASDGQGFSASRFTDTRYSRPNWLGYQWLSHGDWK